MNRQRKLSGLLLLLLQLCYNESSRLILQDQLWIKLWTLPGLSFVHLDRANYSKLYM